MQDAAYEDGPLPIGFGQTISQPFTVAFMCEGWHLNGTEKSAGNRSRFRLQRARAVAAGGFGVRTIERVPELANEAGARLTRLGYVNVHVITGDGTTGGFPPSARSTRSS